MRADCEMSWVTAWQGVWLRDKPCQGPGPGDTKQLVGAQLVSQSDQSIIVLVVTKIFVWRFC